MDTKEQIVARFKPVLEAATSPAQTTHVRLDRLAVLCGLDPGGLFNSDQAKREQQAASDAAEVGRLRAEAEAREAELAELREQVEANQRTNELAPTAAERATPEEATAAGTPDPLDESAPSTKTQPKTKAAGASDADSITE